MLELLKFDPMIIIALAELYWFLPVLTLKNCGGVVGSEAKKEPVPTSWSRGLSLMS